MENGLPVTPPPRWRATLLRALTFSLRVWVRIVSMCFADCKRSGNRHGRSWCTGPCGSANCARRRGAVMPRTLRGRQAAVIAFASRSRADAERLDEWRRWRAVSGDAGRLWADVTARLGVARGSGKAMMTPLRFEQTIRRSGRSRVAVDGLARSRSRQRRRHRPCTAPAWLPCTGALRADGAGARALLSGLCGRRLEGSPRRPPVDLSRREFGFGRVRDILAVYFPRAVGARRIGLARRHSAADDRESRSGDWRRN